MLTFLGLPQMRSPMMSPSRRSGSGDLRKSASRSANSTLNPACGEKTDAASAMATDVQETPVVQDEFSFNRSRMDG